MSERNPYDLRKELTLRMTQRINEYDFEIEAVRGKEKVEVAVRLEDGGVELLGDFEVYELERIAQFFKNAHEAVEKLEAGSI